MRHSSQVTGPELVTGLPSGASPEMDSPKRGLRATAEHTIAALGLAVRDYRSTSSKPVVDQKVFPSSLFPPLSLSRLCPVQRQPSPPCLTPSSPALTPPSSLPMRASRSPYVFPGLYPSFWGDNRSCGRSRVVANICKMEHEELNEQLGFWDRNINCEHLALIVLGL